MQVAHAHRIRFACGRCCVGVPAGGGDHETSAAGDELMRKAAKKMDKWSVEQR